MGHCSFHGELPLTCTPLHAGQPIETVLIREVVLCNSATFGTTLKVEGQPGCPHFWGSQITERIHSGILRPTFLKLLFYRFATMPLKQSTRSPESKVSWPEGVGAACPSGDTYQLQPPPPQPHALKHTVASQCDGT